MKKKIRKGLMGAGLVLVACSALAQGVYRCGNSYSQQPCPGGMALPVDDQPPSPSEQASARAHATRDAKLADGMEQGRLKEEAKPVAAYIPPPKADAAREDAKPTWNRPIKPSPFKARSSAVPPAKEKIRKAPKPQNAGQGVQQAQSPGTSKKTKSGPR